MIRSNSREDQPAGPRRAMLRAARYALASPFLFSGIDKLLNFSAARAEVEALTGLQPTELFAAFVIATQLGGTALFVAGGRWARAGGILLAAFTLLATIVAHDFWTKTGVARVRDATTFLEHMGLIAGLLLAGALQERQR